MTKLFEVVLLHGDITQRDLKNSSPWYTCDLSPHQVSAMLVHYTVNISLVHDSGLLIMPLLANSRTVGLEAAGDLVDNL